MKIAHIYIEHQSSELNRTFTYGCGLLNVQSGVRVIIPFRNREIIGWVDCIEEIDGMALTYQVKNIIKVIDE